jgi:hypothetical protein
MHVQRTGDKDAPEKAMRTHRPDVRRYWSLSAIVVLIVGLTAAAIVYITAAETRDNALGYEQGNGTVYPVMPDDSKSYRRGLEMYGGKANLLADGIRRWLGGLWHGKRLAVTIAVLVIVASLGIIVVGNYLLPPP